MMSIIAAPPLAPAPSPGRGVRGVQQGGGGEPGGVPASWCTASGWGPHPSLQGKVLPSNNDNLQHLVGMAGPNGSVFAQHFGIDGWKEAVE